MISFQITLFVKIICLFGHGKIYFLVLQHFRFVSGKILKYNESTVVAAAAAAAAAREEMELRNFLRHH